MEFEVNLDDFDKKEKFKDIFHKHPMHKGYLTVVVKNKNGEVKYNGGNFLSALHPLYDIDVLECKELRNEYEVVLDSEEIEIDNELLNEMLDEAGY